jgi:hypothetical protein
VGAEHRRTVILREALEQAGTRRWSAITPDGEGTRSQVPAGEVHARLHDARFRRSLVADLHVTAHMGFARQRQLVPAGGEPRG